jgi:RNase adaptor protein for sRNA GlmZ degradation
VAALLDQAVASYRTRGFGSLSVGFGCTGGQHRSVYFAEWLTRRLRQQGVAVHLQHLEQPALSR